MARVRRQYYRQARFSDGTAAQWTAENPVLYLGEPGFETDTRKLKVGDGITAWNSLSYTISGAEGVTDHGELDGLSDDDHTQYATNVELTAHLDDAAAAHAASAISASSATLVGIGTDVQAVLEELDDAIAALAVPAYLVGASTGTLDNEIVVGATPGGELGGTWASPTVDATHSGSAHGDAVTTHEAAGDPHTGYRLESADHSHASTGAQAGNIAATAVTVDSTNLDGVATNVQTVLEELETQVQAAASTHAGAADPHTGYRLESADHTHQSTGAQAGQLTVAALSDAPAGELGGTWASPTVDATHSGSTHSAATDTHIADGTDAHDASAVSFDPTGLTIITAANVQDAMEELDAAGAGEGSTAATAISVNADGFEELAGTDAQTAFDETDARLQDIFDALEDSEVAIDEHLAAHPGADAHIADATDAHDASAISVDSTDLVGVGDDVQEVLGELDDAIALIVASDVLVGTATTGFSGEIVVGTTPGGELGNTWASPTVDATHAGSTHSAATDTHIADTDDAHDASAISIADAGNDFTATTVEGALDELQADNEAHAAAADPHAGYVLESLIDAANDYIRGSAADTVARQAASAATPAAVSTSGATGTAANAPSADDHVHAHEAAHINHDTTWAALGDLIVGTANDTAAVLSKGTQGQGLVVDTAEATDLKWVTNTMTIGCLINGGGSAISTGVHPVWRAPYACTVTAVRGYVDTGTTTVINAALLGTGDFCSSDITIDPADAWEAGTVNQNATLAAGDTVSVEVVTAGTATELTIQVEVVRA